MRGTVYEGCKSKFLSLIFFFNCTVVSILVVLCMCGTPTLYDPFLIIITQSSSLICAGGLQTRTAALMFPEMFAFVPSTKNQPLRE